MRAEAILIEPDASSPASAGSGGIPRRKRIVVGFAGGGGSSLAIAAALGVHPDVAINHWDKAILCHQRNFPDCAHYQSDIFEVDPAHVLTGEEIGLAWFSPDCRHHSKAKGAAPVSPRVRGLAWVVVQWAKRPPSAGGPPDVIFMENVEEWLDWGPLIDRGDGRLVPDPARRGVTAELWFKRMRQAGYAVEHRVSRAADFGDPQIRRRMLVIARRDGRPIVWPAELFAASEKAAAKGLAPHVPASSFIDFSRPCPSIFLNPAEAKAAGARRPLKPATERRIARGLYRHSIAKAKPFIVSVTHPGEGRSYDVGEALRTATTANRGEFALVSPVLLPFPPEGKGSGDGGLAPTLAVAEGSPHPGPTDRPSPPGGGYVAHLLKLSENSINGQDPARPLDTVMAGAPRHGVVAAFIEQANTGMIGREADAALSTVVGKGCTQRVVEAELVAPSMVRDFGKSVGSAADDAVGTVTAGGGGKVSLVAAQLSHFRTSNTAGGNAALDDPLTVNVAGGNHHAVLTAHLDAYYGAGSVGGDAGEPMRVATALARHSLVVAQLSAVADHGRRPQVLAFLRAHFGEPTEADHADPLASAESRVRFGIVLIPPFPLEGKGSGDGGLSPPDAVAESSPHPDPRPSPAARPSPPGGGLAFIVDIGMRMLDPETELRAAMGWPASYVLGETAAGKVTKSVITKLVGNGVCLHWAAAHISANCADLPWWREPGRMAA